MQSIDNHDIPKPLVLTPKQQDVLGILQSKQTEKYPLSRWYTGALYALNNHYNPDRVAQAAHSLRELLEKLPEIVHGDDVKVRVPGFAEKRNIINERLLKAKKRYPEGWKGKPIDKNVTKLLTDVEEYLELTRQPTRREQIQQTLATIDPMVNSLDSETREAKRDRYYHLWDQLENFAHHKSNPDIAEFNNCLKELENAVLDLLALKTAQDQKEIQTILNLSDKSKNDIQRMFSLIKRKGANFVFFFRQVSENADVTWLPYLEKRGYFAHPPNVQLIDDESVIFPFWWPIHYLAKISNQAPNEVIELVGNLPPVSNPLVYDGVMEIALQLHGDQSAKLKSKILESVSIEYQSRTHRYADLLAHWVKENQISVALELSKILVAFAPDPQSSEKQKRRKEDPMKWGTLLYPAPRIKNSWEYSRIMTHGVYPLAESESYEVARLLIYAVSNMFRLRIHQDDPGKKLDFSDTWFPRLHGSDKSYDNHDKTLVYGLTFACEKVFEKSQEAITDLDKLLRKQKWKVFERLRHHLYAQYPNEETKEWIRELIFEREDYDQFQHSYEFQQMIRAACDHFKEELLTRAERRRIFDTILSGPSKEDYRDIMDDRFTEERFLKHQHYFHQRQFAPFASVLFGKYKMDFQKLEKEADDPISDEDYPPYEVNSGWVSNRSPRSSEDLANLTDEDLLAYINTWEKEDKFSESDPFVKVNIEALADAFQTFFRESIIPDVNRLGFWIDNRELIERPIYVRMMINAMQVNVKEHNFDHLEQWLTFSEWILTHPDREYEGDHRANEESREDPDWSSTRRAASDFIRTCLEKDVEVPIVARGQLAKILQTLCTQFDSRLDRHLNPIDPRIDPLTEGINSTRGRALEDLIKFGFWLRRYDSACEVPELTTILEKRVAQENGVPRLTLPEYAILGANYPQIVNLNKTWAIKHKSDFFPQNVLPEWVAAFESLVGYSKSSITAFKILQEDFNFALKHLSDFRSRKPFGEEPINVLGEHLFTYYLWDLYPLRGDGSLLEQYYQRTDNSPEYWGNLFSYIGRRLSNGGEDLDQNLKEKIIKFCEWRLDQKNPTELKHFTFWLQAECLDAGWRLSAYSKALDVCEVEDWGFHFKTLCEMLPNHTAEVVECFFKLTERIKKDNFYIQPEEAKTILKMGRESCDEDTRHMAKRALDNLLKSGRFVLPDLVD